MDSINRRLFNVLLEKNKHYLKGIVLNAGAGKKHYVFGKKTVNIDFVKFPGIDVVSNLEKIPFKNNYFDSVVCNFVFEHVKNPFLVCNELKRVLKPKGTILIAVPFMQRFHADPNDYWRFTDEGIKEMLGKNFVIIKNCSIGGRFCFLAAFFEEHNFPRFLIEFFFNCALFLESKFEKNQRAWTQGFFIIAKKL